MGKCFVCGCIHNASGLASALLPGQKNLMPNHFIFGYGSLVNRATHEFETTHPATLSGWRRVWQFTTRREVAFLNVVPDANSQIDGLILNTPRTEPDLKAREYAYEKVRVCEHVSHNVDRDIEVNLFAIAPFSDDNPNQSHSLLLSYIDVVVQGYYRLLGEQGVQDFFETTHGWGAPIINDRAAPVYPRHQTLSLEETALCDHWLSRLSAVVE